MNDLQKFHSKELKRLKIIISKDRKYIYIYSYQETAVERLRKDKKLSSIASIVIVKDEPSDGSLKDTLNLMLQINNNKGFSTTHC